MARIGNEHAEEAARLLVHYFALVGLDDSEPDYRAEIRFIVDEIVTAAVMAVQGFEPPPAPSREEIEHAIDRDSATFSGRSAGLIDEAERFAAKARQHPGNRSYGSPRSEEDLIEDGERPDSSGGWFVNNERERTELHDKIREQFPRMLAEAGAAFAAAHPTAKRDSVIIRFTPFQVVADKAIAEYIHEGGERIAGARLVTDDGREYDGVVETL